jgi:hypothetical protein
MASSSSSSAFRATVSAAPASADDTPAQAALRKRTVGQEGFYIPLTSGFTLPVLKKKPACFIRMSKRKASDKLNAIFLTLEVGKIEGQTDGEFPLIAISIETAVDGKDTIEFCSKVKEKKLEECKDFPSLLQYLSDNMSLMIPVAEYERVKNAFPTFRSCPDYVSTVYPWDPEGKHTAGYVLAGRYILHKWAFQQVSRQPQNIEDNEGFRKAVRYSVKYYRWVFSGCKHRAWRD